MALLRETDEIATLCIAGLYCGSTSVAADGRGTRNWRGRGSTGRDSLARHCACHEHFLLPPAEHGDGWARRLAALTMAHDADACCWRAAGGFHRSLRVRQDSRSWDSRGN